MRVPLFVAFLLSLSVVGCAGTVVMSGGGAESPNGELRMGIVLHIGPGRSEREHRIFVGIGDRADNPATKYLRREYAFRLTGRIDTVVSWEGSDRVTLSIVEYPDTERISANEKDKPSGRVIATYTYARSPGSLMFDDVKGPDVR